MNIQRDREIQHHILNSLALFATPKKLKKYHVLEIGSGFGHTARIYCNFFKKYDAIDKDNHMINGTIKNTHPIYYNLIYYVDDIMNTKLQNNKYKIIFAHNTIHYIYSLGNALHNIFENIYRLLKKIGICIIIESLPRPMGWLDPRLNSESDQFNENIWMRKKNDLDITHNYIMENCNNRYFEGMYHRCYVIKNIRNS